MEEQWSIQKNIRKKSPFLLKSFYLGMNKFKKVSDEFIKHIFHLIDQEKSNNGEVRSKTISS